MRPVANGRGREAVSDGPERPERMPGAVGSELPPGTGARPAVTLPSAALATLSSWPAPAGSVLVAIVQVMLGADGELGVSVSRPFRDDELQHQGVPCTPRAEVGKVDTDRESKPAGQASEPAALPALSVPVLLDNRGPLVCVDFD